MNGRNPSIGRHAIGAPIAKSGSKPIPRTGRATGSFVGTGVNAKTKSPGRYSGTQPKASADAPAESWINQSPSPWDNSQASSNPTTGASPAGPSAKVGGLGGKTGTTGPVKGRAAGSAGVGSQPQANMNAASTGVGKGQENGNVIGKSQSRRVGNVFNQPRGSSPGGFKGRGGAPSFYGR